VYKHVWQPWQLTIKKKTWQSTLPSFTMLQAWGKANFKVEDMTQVVEELLNKLKLINISIPSGT
jgi:hypothetical protein